MGVRGHPVWGEPQLKRNADRARIRVYQQSDAPVNHCGSGRR